MAANWQTERECDFCLGERIFFVWNRGSAVCLEGEKGVWCEENVQEEEVFLWVVQAA